MYTVPDQFYYRIHHIRPRFKHDVENVLLFMATEIARLNPADSEIFKVMLNDSIRCYPGNANKTLKTINNWRTEISSLFGLIEYQGDIAKPGKMAYLLSQNQDLVEFFRYFLFYFQYPGGHLKPHETLELIRQGVRFKPAKYIIEVFLEGRKLVDLHKFGITKAEATHCIFNDLRVTTGLRSPKETAELILKNRVNNVAYDEAGDIVRYAGDILDYMELADLVSFRPNQQYYLNTTHVHLLQAFVDSNNYFAPYEMLRKKPDCDQSDVVDTQHEWFSYVNKTLDSSIFKADVLSIIGDIGENAKAAEQSDFVREILSRVVAISAGEKTKTKEVGDIGEAIVIVHEKTRLSKMEREDLIHLVHKIPESFAVGYDIQSFDGEGDLRRFIEVKTTVSRGKLSATNFHLTRSEWSAASTHRLHYFVYRLMISKDSIRLFMIKDPVGKYKQDLLKMSINDGGADIRYTEKSGNWEKLLV